jgi:hypothetical protein
MTLDTMTNKVTNKKLRSRLDQIMPKIESPDFLKNQGLGNEIGFYVFDYPAESELEVREHLTFITSKLNKRDRNFANINGRCISPSEN